MEHWIEEGDAAAFKGSSRVLLEYSVDMVYGTRCTDQRFLDENEYKRIKKNDLSYNLFKEYGTLVKGPKNYREVVINSKLSSNCVKKSLIIVLFCPVNITLYFILPPSLFFSIVKIHSSIRCCFSYFSPRIFSIFLHI